MVRVGVKSLLAEWTPVRARDIDQWHDAECGFAADTPPRVLAAAVRRHPGFDEAARQVVVDAAAHLALPDEVRAGLVAWAGRFSFEAPSWVAVYGAVLNPATSAADAVAAAETGDEAALCGALERPDLTSGDVERLARLPGRGWPTRVLSTFARHPEATEVVLRTVLDISRGATRLDPRDQRKVVTAVFAHPRAPKAVARQVVVNIWHLHLAGDPKWTWDRLSEPNTGLPSLDALVCLLDAGVLDDEPESLATIARLGHRLLTARIVRITADPDVLHAIVESNADNETLIRVAQHPATGPETLTVLCDHRIGQVRRAAAAHRSCPASAAAMVALRDHEPTESSVAERQV